MIGTYDVSASTFQVGYEPWRAVDLSFGITEWAITSANVSTGNIWWWVKLPVARSVAQVQVTRRLTSPAYAYLQNFNFQASNNGTNWTNLITNITDLSNVANPGGILRLNINDPTYTEYSYYRVYQASPSTSGTSGMYFFQLYGWMQTPRVLTGPTGPTGPQGISGTAENTGATGPTGPTFSGGTVSSLTVAGPTQLQQIGEVINSLTGATGTVTHDWSSGAIFYHSSIAANFTANITNLPTTALRTYTVTLILEQGSSAYYSNVLQIAGSAQTINWANNATPVPGANKKEIQTYTLINKSATSTPSWVVFGDYGTYG